MANIKKIDITCDTKELVNINKVENLQGNLKSISDKSMQKLKNSIIGNGFAFPIFAWKKGERIYSIDGIHRIKALKGLEREGYKIPTDLPVVYITAKDEKRAKKLLLAATSQYAKVSQVSFNQFIEDLDLLDIELEIEIPEIDILDDKEAKIKKENLNPFEQVHFLISVPVDKFHEVQEYIFPITLIEGVEVEQGQN
ncbi:MAG TPA: ParB N-terminal domain-containing protein [Bacteroidales bacterium]|nr:ParB N-terminal domain-containing protein [Bacteroidales bacterium]